MSTKYGDRICLVPRRAAPKTVETHHTYWYFGLVGHVVVEEFEDPLLGLGSSGRFLAPRYLPRGRRLPASPTRVQ